jgi:Zn-dependent peptidase ImmA (M78 family)
VTELRPFTEGREKSEALRFEHSLGTAPIRDLFGLVETAVPGILPVRRPMPGGPDGVLLRARGRWLLIVNTDGRMMRQQRFAAAHLLAHLLFEGSEPGQVLHVDRRMLGTTSAVERRADAFAAHLLLPAQALQLQLGGRDPSTWGVEELVVLALEYGISTHALHWHLGHVLRLDEAGRRHLAALPEPSPEQTLFIASRAGLWELVHRGRAARDTVGWPRRYVALALRAYDRGLVSETELLRLLVDPELVRDAVELGRAVDARPGSPTATRGYEGGRARTKGIEQTITH